MTIVLVLTAVAAGATSTYLLSVRGSDTKTEQSQQQNQKGATKKACDIFTLQDAKELLGQDAKQGSQEVPDISAPAPAPPSDKDIPPPVPEDPRSKNIKPPQANSSLSAPGSENRQESVESSSCSYSRDDQADPVQADLLITLRRSTPEQLKKDFDSVRGQAAEKVSGYGEDAYWRTGKDFSGKDFGQLVILNSATLVMVSGNSNDMELYKKAAGVALDNL